MIQAASEGIIDFSKADPRDRKWWLSLCWIINKLEDRNLTDIVKLRFDQHASMLSSPHLDGKGFDSHWNGCNSAYKDILNIHFPWFKKAKDQPADVKHKDMFDEWKRRFGDLKDPQVRKKYDKMAEDMVAHKKRIKENREKKESDNARLKKVMKNRRNRKRG